jgi:hypothetical protein
VQASDGDDSAAANDDVERSHFGRAARALMFLQPALTRSIQAPKAKLGLPLRRYTASTMIGLSPLHVHPANG